MTIQQAIQKVIDLARSQIGYTEGAHNNNKYAHDFDTIWTDWYNGKKNFNDWCAIFTAWLLVSSFGEKVAGKMLNHSSVYGKLSAVVQYLYRSLQAVGRVGKKPHPGDIIFYHNNKGEGLGRLCHVGIVWKVEGDYVTTIEGNSGKNNTEVATRTIRKNYDTESWGVYGFGYPDYSAAADVPDKYPAVPFDIRALTVLDVRKDPYSDTPIVAKIPKKRIVTVTEIGGSSGDFGRIDQGWIYLAQPKNVRIFKDQTIKGYTVGKTYTVVCKEDLNIREYSGLNSKIIGTMKPGTKVTMMSGNYVSKNMWIHCSEGWVCAFEGNDVYIK